MHINEPHWIQREPRNHFMFDMILRFLDNASLAHARAPILATEVTQALLVKEFPNPSLDEYRLVTITFFAIILTIVTQLDSDAIRQDHMVLLVLSVRSLPLPATVVQGIDPGDLDDNMNEDLAKLVNVWAKFDADAPVHPPLRERQGMEIFLEQREPWQQEPGHYLTSEAWASASAFVARVYATVQDGPRLDLWGLYTMIEALERPRTPAQLGDVMPAAAAWIVHAGQALKCNDFSYACYDIEDEAKRSAWSKGELWNGQHAFNPARWDFWMRRFKNISERSDVSDAVRLAALRALQAGSELPA